MFFLEVSVLCPILQALHFKAHNKASHTLFAGTKIPGLRSDDYLAHPQCRS